MTTSVDEALQTVFEQLGGPAKVASALDISVQAVSQWTRVPVKRVWDVSSLTGLKPSELRPDIFREPERAA